MSDEYEEERKQFAVDHPWPDQSGITRLFRYVGFDSSKKDRLEALFIDRKLYHSLPEQFNDPFECKPLFKLPTSQEKIKKIATHLQRVAIENGVGIDKATRFVVNGLLNPEILESTIIDAAQKTYGQVRICCFTTHNRNLLLWSHYADSHKGLCIEFDSTKFPISYAYKVKYNDNFPTIEYPRPENELGFLPVLVKSTAWAYEDEYRLIYTPESPVPIEVDGPSVILGPSDITGVYLGAKMDGATASTILEIINNGPFKPKIWKANLSKISYEIDFVPYNGSA